jgi:hypothetical protein
MPGKILGENVTFQIEVQDRPKALLLVLDRKCDYCITHWEDAFNLAKTMEQVVKDVAKEFTAHRDFALISREQAQVRLSHHKGLVALVFDHTDRLTFTTLEAFLLVARALRKVAQDSHFEMDKGIKFQYDREGMISLIHNMRSGETQFVR